MPGTWWPCETPSIFFRKSGVCFRTCRAGFFKTISHSGTILQEIRDLLTRAIEDNPPATVKEGGLIKPDFDSNLDHLREIATKGKKWIVELESRERLATGISSLKVRYNRVFGYYIEVTKSNLPSVPPRYLRKQTLTNAERFITQELQEYETQVLTAEEQKDALEYEIFQQILGKVATRRFPNPADGRGPGGDRCAERSGRGSRAERVLPPGSGFGKYFGDPGGKTSGLEKISLDERFVPNDLHMDAEERQILIITGPNMAGKSTIMRQTALIVIMAQMGSFVPAQEARIGLVDRIFTRVGATDDLAAAGAPSWWRWKRWPTSCATWRRAA